MTDAITLPQGILLAAIDMGSNSFHLNITQVDRDEIRPLHTLSERVQLGEAADTGELTQAAIRRGLACLEQFKRLMRQVPTLSGSSAPMRCGALKIDMTSLPPPRPFLAYRSKCLKAKKRQDSFTPASHRRYLTIRLPIW